VTRAASPLADVALERVPVPHGELAVASTGAGNNGATVVFVPGYTGSKEDFGALLHPLARAGFRPLAFDQRGQYESPTRIGLAHDPEALAEDLLALVAARGRGPVHVVGHSFGGFVVRAAVLAAPEAFASVVLMDSGPAALPAGARVDAMVHLRPILLETGIDAVWARYEAFGGGDATEFARDRFLRNDPRALLAMGDAVLAEPDRTDALSARCAAAGLAVLVLCGAEDDAWPAEVQREMAARLGARFVQIAGAAHSPAIEQPERTLQALAAFWDSIAAGQLAGDDSVTTS
jgi:pimeloyl-ACP methyl ester carboxylesterase